MSTLVTVVIGSLGSAINEATPIDASRAKTLVPLEWTNELNKSVNP